jgi:hypothetical protein
MSMLDFIHCIGYLSLISRLDTGYNVVMMDQKMIIVIILGVAH